MSNKSYGDAMSKFADTLPRGGLIYVSDRDDPKMLKSDGRWPSCLLEDKYLSTIERSYEQKSFCNWKPKVFRKA